MNGTTTFLRVIGGVLLISGVLSIVESLLYLSSGDIEFGAAHAVLAILLLVGGVVLVRRKPRLPRT